MEAVRRLIIGMGVLAAGLQVPALSSEPSPTPKPAVSQQQKEPAKPVPEKKATVWFVQLYEPKEGKIEEFREWFQKEGGPGFLTFDGLASVETWVDLVSPGPTLTTVFGFTDYTAIDRWYKDPAQTALGEKFDGFIGPHKHFIVRQYPIYKSRGLTWPPVDK